MSSSQWSWVGAHTFLAHTIGSFVAKPMLIRATIPIEAVDAINWNPRDGHFTGSELADWAGYSSRTSHSRYFWGLRPYLVWTPAGMPITWSLTKPKIDERAVLPAMLDREPYLLRADLTCCSRTMASLGGV